MNTESIIELQRLHVDRILSAVLSDMGFFEDILNDEMISRCKYVGSIKEQDIEDTITKLLSTSAEDLLVLCDNLKDKSYHSQIYLGIASYVADMRDIEI